MFRKSHGNMLFPYIEGFKVQTVGRRFLLYSEKWNTLQSFKQKVFHFALDNKNLISTV